MCRCEQVIGVFAVLQAENSIAIFGPAAGNFVGLARKQRWKMNLLGSGAFHLVMNDVLDLASNAKSERQPGKDSRSLTTDVPGAHQQAVRRHFRVGRVFAQSANEQLRETGNHGCQPIVSAILALSSQRTAPTPTNRAHRFLQTPALAPPVPADNVAKIGASSTFWGFVCRNRCDRGACAAERARHTPLLRLWKPNRSIPTFLETDHGIRGKVARNADLVTTNARNRAFGFHKRGRGDIRDGVWVVRSALRGQVTN